MKCPCCKGEEVYYQDRYIDDDDELGSFTYRCEDCGCEFMIEERMTILEEGTIEDEEEDE